MTAEQTERLVVALEVLAYSMQRIADNADKHANPEDETTSDRCKHPDEMRVSLATAGNLRKFFCKACNEYVNG
jgi:hypothetical protein